VDEASAKKITDFFEQLREQGKTILISTHVQNLAKLADKTYVINDGKVVKSF
jgi:ABC-type lipoprotein export system ATPase subunit